MTVLHLKSDGAPQTWYINAKLSNELTAFAAYTARNHATEITLVGTDSTIGSGDSRQQMIEVNLRWGFDCHSCPRIYLEIVQPARRR